MNEAYFTKDQALEAFGVPDEKQVITPDQSNVVKTPINLEGYSFALDVWRFHYWESKDGTKNGINFDGLYYDGIFERLNQMGFYNRRPPGNIGSENNQNAFFIRDDNGIIEPVKISFILECFRKHHIEPVQDLMVEYKDTRVKFPAESLREKFNLQFNNVFNEKTLRALPLHTMPILEDTKEASYFFFKNGIVKVTADGRSFSTFADLKTHCIWKSRLIKHPYHKPKESGGHWRRFIGNVSKVKSDLARGQAFNSAIGYLLHNYNSSAMGQAVICYDEKLARKGSPEGGSGKGLFFQGIKQLRDYATIDGKSFQEDDRFKWQQIYLQTQVVCIDDPKTTFRLETLFSALTEGWSIEYKNKDKIFIPPDDIPKVCITTNSALSSDGSSNKRRQFIIEFSDHYSRQIVNGNETPIISEHERVFFSDNPNDGWTKEDWSQFFDYQLSCVEHYLKYGLITYEPKNVVQNQLLQSTDEDFAEWIEQQNFEIKAKYDKKTLFEDFTQTYHGANSTLTQRKFTDWLKKWARLQGFEVEQPRSGKISYIRFTQRSK